MNLLENHTTEFKMQVTDKIENEVVAFLNSKDGGNIYIGVDNDGNVIGLDDIDSIQLQLSDKIKNNIKPATLGLFDIIVKTQKDKKYIHLIVTSGLEKPYYIAKSGMSPKGCYIRVGSGNQQMSQEMIEDLFSSRTRNSLAKIPSPRKRLTFEQLQIYYQAKDLSLNDKFRENLELLTDDDRYNYIGYLLADDNGVSIKVAKYAGTDKVDLIENEEYGYCSIIKALKSVLNKLEIENVTRTKITSKERIEKKLVDPIALREAVINAFVHNDYTSEVPPVIEIFSDRLQITSYGGLVSGLSEQDFFECRSMPRNRELIRVFKDLDLVEQLGSGMARILRAYDKSSFKITPNFLEVTFMFDEIVNHEDDIVKVKDDTRNHEKDTRKAKDDTRNHEKDTRKAKNDTRNHENDTRKAKGDTRNHENDTRKVKGDTRNHEKDTRKAKDDTRNRENDTRKAKNDTRNHENDTRKAKGDTRNHENDLINPDEKILDLIENDKKITIKAIGSALGVSTSTINRRVSKLKQGGILSREGATKKGNWILNRK